MGSGLGSALNKHLEAAGDSTLTAERCAALRRLLHRAGTRFCLSFPPLTRQKGRERDPPQLPVPTDLFELVGEVQKGDGHADGLQEHGGDEHSRASLRGAGAGCGQHHGQAALA